MNRIQDGFLIPGCNKKRLICMADALNGVWKGAAASKGWWKSDDGPYKILQIMYVIAPTPTLPYGSKG